MYDENYLEKILGEKYNINNYFEGNTNENTIVSNRNDTNISMQKNIGNTVNSEKKENNIKKTQSNIEHTNTVTEHIKNTQNINNKEKIEKDLKKIYPEIYRIIVPMIEVVVDKNKGKNITADLVDEMAREIYDALVIDIDSKKVDENTDKIKKPKNSILLDLIKILILDNLKRR